MRAGVIEPVQIHIRQMIVLVVEAPGRTLRKAGPMVRILFPPAASRTNSESGRRRTSIKHHRTVQAVEATAFKVKPRLRSGTPCLGLEFSMAQTCPLCS
jgi:hypothetical protein